MTAVIQEESTTLSNEEDGLYELTLNEDGTVARITTRNSNGSNVASVVVGVLAIAKIVDHSAVRLSKLNRKLCGSTRSPARIGGG